MEKTILILLLGLLTRCAAAADTLLVADQTFRLDGRSEYICALAEGDQILLDVWMVNGKKIRNIAFFQHPDNLLFSAHDMDSSISKILLAPQTGVYLLRLEEKGSGKKICRFTLKRVPASEETARFITRVNWDLRQYPEYQIRRRAVTSGYRTEVTSLGGQITVPAGKFGLKKPVNAYQFTLPPHTVRWAYRLSVGQAGAEARTQDAQKFSALLKAGGVKMLAVQPETALAAFALGAALDMTVKASSGDDVSYALVDASNLPLFYEEKKHKAYMSQNRIAVDVQRRYTPTEGTYYFALRSGNWVNDISVHIEIEAVTEIPVYATESWLEPIKP